MGLIGTDEALLCRFGGSGHRHTERMTEEDTRVVACGSYGSGLSLSFSQYRLCLLAAEMAMCSLSLGTTISPGLGVRCTQSSSESVPGVDSCSHVLCHVGEERN